MLLYDENNQKERITVIGETHSMFDLIKFINVERKKKKLAVIALPQRIGETRMIWFEPVLTENGKCITNN